MGVASRYIMEMTNMKYTMTMISNIISKSDISSKQLKRAIRIVKMEREIIEIENRKTHKRI